MIIFYRIHLIPFLFILYHLLFYYKPFIFVCKIRKIAAMNRVKSICLFLLMLCTISITSCSKSDDEQTVLSKTESNLIDGYYYDKYKSNQAIRFFPDHTFRWMEKNGYDKYHRDSEAVYTGVWKIENESDVVLDWDGYSVPNKKAPTLMLRISFVDGKMAFADQNGANCLYIKDQPSTFIHEEMIGRTFAAGNAYTYAGLKLKNTQTLIFKENGMADWKLEERFQENSELRHQYYATGKSWLNISEDEIYIEWFYEGEGNIPYDEVVAPPLRMTHLRSEVNEKGLWLLYFQDGYAYLNNTNYVRK